MADNKNIYNIPKEKFAFVHEGERISDKKFEDKPIGYMKDAWIRFRKSGAAVVGAIIIILVVLYSFIAPLLITTHDNSFMVSHYSKKPGRLVALKDFGIFDGGVEREFSDKGMIRLLAMGMGAEDAAGTGKVTLEQGMASAYQPMIEIHGEVATNNKKDKYYSGRLDTYLEVGFIYIQIEQSELETMRAWEQETGKQLIFPLIEKNDFNPDPSDANNWYKMDSRYNPVRMQADGISTKTIKYSEGMVLEDNYKRDANGNPVYYEYTGGGDVDTAAYKLRVLYYNYYQYRYGFEPDYVLGTDASGYDLALRIAGGIQLSLMIAIAVCVINFILGAIYGAVEGYYGGVIDLVLERISDILSGVPFIIVATLFQIHLAKKVGPIPSLLFAYVVTGWIGTAARVRTQFYRFKNQEYVMAARTLGARDRRIIWKHIFPNTLGTLITSSALAIPSSIMSESMLSFLGIVKLGGAEGTSLGTLLSDASKIWTNYPHLMLYPAIIISLLMISFNLFGNGLRDAFNPALRGVEE